MKVEYFLIEEKIKTEEFEIYDTYGIAARCNNDVMTELKFSDVSLDRSFAENILNILNSHEVEICHFYDVVLDELNREFI